MTRHAPDIDSSAPEALPSMSAGLFSDPSFMRSFGDTGVAPRGSSGEQVVISNPYPAGADAAATPLLDGALKQQIGAAQSVVFSTAAENQSSGATPDYRVVRGEDGKMTLEKVGNGDPLADGKLNIEVEAKNNESLAEAIKQADENLKEYIREMMVYWQQNHPGKPFPGWWNDILNRQPNIPQDAQPVPVRAAQPDVRPDQIPAPRQADAAPQPAPSSSRSGGGSGGGSGSGGGGGGSGGGSRSSGGYRGGGEAPARPMGDNPNPGPDVSLNDKAPVAMQIMDYFVEKGLTPQQAAGIVGNLQRESGLDPGIEEKGNGIGFGLAQWSFERRTNLENYAREQGKPVSDLKLQLDFMWHEMNTTESATLAAFKANPNMSASEAARVFEQKYERAGIVALGERQSAANSALAHYQSNGGEAATATARVNNPTTTRNA